MLCSNVMNVIIIFAMLSKHGAGSPPFNHRVDRDEWFCFISTHMSMPDMIAGWAHYCAFSTKRIPPG